MFHIARELCIVIPVRSINLLERESVLTASALELKTMIDRQENVLVQSAPGNRFHSSVTVF